MPSDFIEILLDIQKDLNQMTISTVASNRALSKILEMYNDGTYTPDKNKQRTEAWSSSLGRLSEAMVSFINDAARLEAYINGQR